MANYRIFYWKIVRELLQEHLVNLRLDNVVDYYFDCWLAIHWPENFICQDEETGYRVQIVTLKLAICLTLVRTAQLAI